MTKTRFPILLVIASLAWAGCLGADAPAAEDVDTAGDPSGAFAPRVIVGIADTGINPYHEMFYRPELTEPPCTYIRDFPCDVKELRLTLGGTDWDAAFAQDEEVWRSLERDTWYWIPQTVFVAIRCDSLVTDDKGDPVPREDICLLDDDHDGPGSFPNHGTGVTSIVMQENPDALLAFREGWYDGPMRPFVDDRIPLDVASVSLGNLVPRPVRPRTPPEQGDACEDRAYWPIHVRPAGNYAWPIPLDCDTGDPRLIVTSGGGTSPARTLNAFSGNAADVTGYFCREYAARNSTDKIWTPGGTCGTSWATPTVAGALSKVILELRRASGYAGTLTPDGYVDPILGVTIGDLRDAMNLTATYTPAPNHERRPDSVYGILEIPVNPIAPWLQWGWGFYDGDVANATIEHLLGRTLAPEKPDAARSHMQGLYDLRKTLYG